MSGIVSRWVVRKSNEVTADALDANGAIRAGLLEQWVADARDAYLERCVTVQSMIEQSKLVARYRVVGLPGPEHFRRPTTVVVSAGVTELYPSSFTMAFRLRSCGTDDDVVANATCEVSLEDPSTGEACELGDAVRDELIALEHAARHTN
jgi:acyl-CoA thioesterase FadM